MGSPLLGSDVSGWQSLAGADYARAVELGERFVIVKLSQGFKASKKGAKHAQKALAAGMPTGAYHFASPLLKLRRKFDPEGQAEVFVRAVVASDILETPWNFTDKDGNPIPRLWLDMEWIGFRDKALGKRFRRQFKPSQVMEWTRRFVGYVHAMLGVDCGIYTGRSYIKYRFSSCEELQCYSLWLAAYVNVGKDRTGYPVAWPEPVALDEGEVWPVTIHQFTGRGSAKWYRLGKGKLDRNRMRVA